jgi:putative ABC transport system substrate-binding protein
MKRREFITVLGGAAAWPIVARAQQREKLPIVGILGSATAAAQGRLYAALVERLRTLGWIDSRTLAIEYRWAEGRAERNGEIAAEFIRLNVSVIVTSGTPAVEALKQATSTVPIVFVGAGDPVSTGLVASLARPGGNVTGLSNQQSDISAKRLEFLRKIIPGLRRVAILANAGDKAVLLNARETERAAASLGLDSVTLEIRTAQDIGPAFENLKGRADALYTGDDALAVSQQNRIHTLALSARLPTFHQFREQVETGGLMSYGPNRLARFRRGAEFVDKILRGTKPANIPVEQPTEFDLVINLTTAKALGLAISPAVLALANEVIE